MFYVRPLLKIIITIILSLITKELRVRILSKIHLYLKNTIYLKMYWEMFSYR